MEAIKIITKMGEPLTRRLNLYDANQGSFMTIKLPGKVDECAACGSAPTITTLQATSDFACSFNLREVEGGISSASSLPELPLDHQVTCKVSGSVGPDV